MIDIETALRTLTQAGVEFIVVGGVAAFAHGSTRLIQAKRDAGRPKDLEVIAELTALESERDGQA